MDYNLADLRHRMNERRSVISRDGYSSTGMFDAKILDDIQVLCAENHNAHVHPGRSNTSDFEDTEERFGTVDLIGNDLKERRLL